MADGAMRSDILRVLGQEQVEVTALPGNRYRLAKGDELLTIRMLETVSRTTCANLERRFGIAKSKFFPALRPVVPIDRPKASGEPE